MTLIRSAQALDMLATYAPRAWCKRLLSWEVFDGRLNLYASQGHIVRFLSAGAILEKAGLPLKLSEQDRADLKVEDEEYADPVLRAADADNLWDNVETTREDWLGREDEALPFGLIPIATVDWENENLSVELLHGLVPDLWLAHAEETFDVGAHETLTASFSGLSFELAAIEMLAPAAVAPTPDPRQPASAPKRIGRPIKWDWEGAMAHIAALANTPDGLPTDSGAQAQIARIMADWFVRQTGQSPADSEVRRRAATILDALTRR